jgi:8-oxo-dGTP diphosphatase
VAYIDKFRLSSHAVITDADDNVLLLKANYGGHDFGLPGGALEPGKQFIKRFNGNVWRS